MLLDKMLSHLRDRGLLKERGRQRTDSTHVLAAVRVMNRLELATETRRAALNSLATVSPDWLRSVAPAEWYTRYGARVEDTRLPSGERARQEFAEAVGRGGYLLLGALEEQDKEEQDKEERPHLGALAAVRTLCQAWDRHFTRSEDGQVRWRPDADLARAATAVESPYDPQARHSNKRALSWTGYKVHLTETCDPDLPRLITDVHTTVATTQDVSCTAEIQQSLADRGLLPERQLVDTGYVDAQLLVDSRRRHGIELFGPTRLNPSWQSREGGYDQSRFAVERERVRCPEGMTSISWAWEAPTGGRSGPGHSRPDPPGPDAGARVKVRFSQNNRSQPLGSAAMRECTTCPASVRAR